MFPVAARYVNEFIFFCFIMSTVASGDELKHSVLTLAI